MKYVLALLLAGWFPAISNAQEQLTFGNRVVVEDRDDWIGALAPMLAQRVQVPPALRETGPWGTFEMSIHYTVLPDGSVSEVNLDQSSGVEAIDSAILAAVEGRSFIPFTPDMTEPSMSFVQPIKLNVNEPEAQPAPDSDAAVQ